MPPLPPEPRSTSYVGRLAPSPTGLLHIGHARTFGTAFDRAEAAGGTLLLRIEDLDRDRSRPEFVEAVLEDLRWLGIRWSDPVITQSERLPLYREALTRLLARGIVYPCTCSRRDLAGMLHAPHEAQPHPGKQVGHDLAHDSTDEPVYLGRCRANTLAAGSDPLLHNLRFRVPDGETVAFADGAAGPQHFLAGSNPSADFGDFLVWRKDGLPSYQLACVVDDASMGITEVVRGLDLLKSTARQLLLARALDLPSPAFFHTPLSVDTAGRRLAKRHDALSLRHLRERGLSPAEILATTASPRASETRAIEYS